MAKKKAPSRKKIKKEIKKSRNTARARKAFQAPMPIAEAITKRRAVKKK